MHRCSIKYSDAFGHMRLLFLFLLLEPINLRTRLFVYLFRAAYLWPCDIRDETIEFGQEGRLVRCPPLHLRRFGSHLGTSQPHSLSISKDYGARSPWLNNAYEWQQASATGSGVAGADPRPADNCPRLLIVWKHTHTHLHKSPLLSAPNNEPCGHHGNLWV